jgi:hypothetical protein
MLYVKEKIVMPKVKLEGYKCERCSHIWLPRKYGEEDPVICTKCP